MDLDNKTKEVWKKAEDCNCDAQDCSKKNHKLCGICDEKMLYGAHESVQPKSKYAWNVDHIKPVSKGGSDNINNLQAVHITCNRSKASN